LDNEFDWRKMIFEQKEEELYMGAIVIQQTKKHVG
jgi:hypothetical protein